MMFYDQEKRRRYDIKMNVEQALNIVKQSLETYIGTPSINALQLFIIEIILSMNVSCGDFMIGQDER